MSRNCFDWMRHLNTLAGLFCSWCCKAVGILHTLSNLIFAFILVGRQYLIEASNLCLELLPLSSLSYIFTRYLSLKPEIQHVLNWTHCLVSSLTPLSSLILRSASCHRHRPSPFLFVFFSNAQPSCRKVYPLYILSFGHLHLWVL